jgi:hypothetical protein
VDSATAKAYVDKAFTAGETFGGPFYGAGLAAVQHVVDKEWDRIYAALPEGVSEGKALIDAVFNHAKGLVSGFPWLTTAIANVQTAVDSWILHGAS